MFRQLRLENAVFILLAVYFALQLVIRLNVAPGLEKDEAEQLLLTQQFSLGYGPQPPLYTWLQLAFFNLFGINIFALALLKNVLLFCTYLFTYKISIALGYSVLASFVAMLSLLFIPQIVWESQRDLTHSVIVTTFTAATVLSWLHLKNNPRSINYLVVGLCCGLGLLSKYNFVIFFLGLLAASLSIPAYRSLLFKRRIFISISAALIVVSPHAIWAVQHLPAVLDSSSKLKMAAQAGYFSSVQQGVASLFTASIAFTALLLFVYLIIWLRYRRVVDNANISYRDSSPNLILGSMVYSLLGCLMIVFIFQVTAFKDRWMQPVLFLLPVALLPLMEKYLTHQQGKLMHRISAAMALFILIAFSSRVALAPYVGVVTSLNYPYSEVIAKLDEQVRTSDLILSQSSLMGGHLRLKYPSARVAIAGSSGLYHDSPVQSVLIVWETGSSWKNDPRLSTLVEKLLGEEISTSSFPEITQTYTFYPEKNMTVSSALLTPQSYDENFALNSAPDQTSPGLQP